LPQYEFYATKKPGQSAVRAQLPLLQGLSAILTFH
jgi:hypothetical protein